MPYGTWLTQAFDRYFSQPRATVRVRLFDEIVRVLLGKPANLESIGLAPARLLVLAPNGELQGVDTLKTTEEGACGLGLNVFANSIDDAGQHPAVRSRLSGIEALAPACRTCPQTHTCGGGYLPHRWADGNGFSNPSVFCEDLRYLVEHISTTVHHVADRLRPAMAAGGE